MYISFLYDCIKNVHFDVSAVGETVVPSYSMIVEISRLQNFSSILHCSARDVNCIDTMCVSKK